MHYLYYVGLGIILLIVLGTICFFVFGLKELLPWYNPDRNTSGFAWFVLSLFGTRAGKAIWNICLLALIFASFAKDEERGRKHL